MIGPGLVVERKQQLNLFKFILKRFQTYKLLLQFSSTSLEILLDLRHDQTEVAGPPT